MSVLLCLQGTAPADSFGGVPAEIRTMNPLEASFPKELGEIKEKFEGRAEKMVFILQDAHAVPDAQRSLQKLIQHIQAVYGVELAVLEGSASELDARIFKSFPDRKLLEKVFEGYLERGEISGASAAALFSPSDSHYHGVEDWPLYEEGLRAFLDALDMEEAFTLELAGLSEALQEEKRKHYSASLLEADSALNAFQRNEANLLSVLKTLVSFLPPEKDSELALLAETEREAGETAPDVLAETERLAETLRAALSEQKDSRPNRNEMAALNRAEQDFRTGRSAPEAYAFFLKTLAVKNEMTFTASPRLENLIDRQKRMRDIEGTRLFDAFERYAQTVKEALFRNDGERELDARGRLLALAGKLARLELSRRDWEEVKSALTKMEVWPISADGVNERGAAARLFLKMKSQTDFYRNAEAREHAFLKQTEALFKKYGVQTAVLVAGGFHAEGLTLRLKERGISYVLVTPAIGGLPEENHYRAHMRGGVSWEKYFRAEEGRVNLYDAFVRGTRDALLAGSGEGRGELLRLWRGEIIRRLAAENKLADAPDLVRFIDELSGRESARGEFISEWRANVDRFLEGLLRLRAENRLSAPEIGKLLRPSAIPAPAGIAFSKGNLSADLMPRVPAPRRYSFERTSRRTPVQRSELRSEELLRGWNEHYRSQEGKPDSEAGHLGIEYRGVNMETGPGSIYEFDFLKEAARIYFEGKDLGLTAQNFSSRKEIEAILGEFTTAGRLPETLRAEIMNAFTALEKAAGKYHSDAKLSGLADRDDFFQSYYRAASLAFNAVTLLTEAMARLRQPPAVTVVNEAEDGLELQKEISLHFSLAEGFYDGGREQIGLPAGTDALAYFRADPRRVFAVFRQASDFALPLSHEIRFALWQYAPEFSALLDAERSGEESTALFKEVSRNFFDFLESPEPVSNQLWEIYRLGLLEALVPEMRKVRHIPANFDIHEFTVGQHTLYNLKRLDEFSGTGEEALQEGKRIIADISPRERLWIRLAQIFHDLGKRATKAPTEPDHAIVSARDIVPLRLKQMGLEDEDIENAAWIVRDHMVLTAFARLDEVRLDVKLPVLLRNFELDPRASGARLRLLYLISLTDRASVSPWYGAIGPDSLKRLNFIYEKLNDYLSTSSADRPREISDLQFEAHTKTQEQWESFKEQSGGKLRAYLGSLDAQSARAYFKNIYVIGKENFEPLRLELIARAKKTAGDDGAFAALLERLRESFSMDQIMGYNEEKAAARLLFLLHLDLLREAGDRSPVLFFNPEYSKTYEQGYEIVFGSAFDGEGLFEKITGVLLRHRFDIEDADVRTLADGGIVDTFTGFFHDDYPDEAAHQIMKENMTLDARGLFLGETTSTEALFTQAQVPYISERSAGDIGTEVLFQEDKEIYGTFSSVFTLKTSNRLGLLHVLSRILKRRGLNIVAAPVSTHPGMVNNTFYVNKNGGGLSLEEKRDLSAQVQTLMAHKIIDISSLTARSELRSAELEEAGRYVVEKLSPVNTGGALDEGKIERLAALAGTDFEAFLAGVEKSADEIFEETRVSEAPPALSEAARLQSGRLLSWLRTRQRPEGGATLALDLGGNAARYGTFLEQLLNAISASGREVRLFADKASQPEVARQIDGKRLSALVSSTPLRARDLDAGLGEVQKNGQADVPIALYDDPEAVSDALSESFLGLALEKGEASADPDVRLHHELLFVTVFLLMPELVLTDDYQNRVRERINGISSEVRADPEEFRKAVKAVKGEVLKEALVRQLGELGYDRSIFSGRSSQFLSLSGDVIAGLLTKIQALESISSSA